MWSGSLGDRPGDWQRRGRQSVERVGERGIADLVGVNIDVNPAAHVGRGTPGVPAYSMVKGDARCLPFADESISSVMSITVFEHVHNFDTALREMYRVLKPGGVLYSDFGPIWSCSIGHHVFAIVDGVEARHFKPGKNPVPHFGHLLMAPDELRAAVLKSHWVFPRLADAIVEWIYRGAGVNRVFFEDYVRMIEQSPFTVRQLTPVREHVPHRTQQALEKACPGYTDFSVRMIEVVLEKPVV